MTYDSTKPLDTLSAPALSAESAYEIGPTYAQMTTADHCSRNSSCVRVAGGGKGKKTRTKREENQESVNQSCLPQYVRLRLVSLSRNRQ